MIGLEELSLKPFPAKSIFANAVAAFVATSVWIAAMVRTLENAERRVETDAVVVDVINGQDTGSGFDDDVILTAAERTQEPRLRCPRFRHKSSKKQIDIKISSKS